jgi:hypothetical protein
MGSFQNEGDRIKTGRGLAIQFCSGYPAVFTVASSGSVEGAFRADRNRCFEALA